MQMLVGNTNVAQDKRLCAGVTAAVGVYQIPRQHPLFVHRMSHRRFGFSISFFSLEQTGEGIGALQEGCQHVGLAAGQS